VRWEFELELFRAIEHAPGKRGDDADGDGSTGAYGEAEAAAV
jgi:hypothetical protein